jgi:cytochrome c oxidase accessory protein FixG
MSTSSAPLSAPGRVLSTLNQDGTRRWIRPRPSWGRFVAWRRGVAAALVLTFLVIPHLRIGGRPLVLLDLPRREFTLFGVTFLASDTLPFMLGLISIMIAVFLVTALAGRVWCGWGCPQTVYMEFLFRPIERWIEGGARGSKKMDRTRGLHPRRWLKHLVYLGLALVLAHTFLAYFVPVDELARWMRRSPVDHPTSFAVMAITTALVFLDFAWFREQTCLVACPYGRLQAVLFDRRTLIVGYDGQRGEPRMRGMPRPAGAGHCVNCELCVLTCPTGIDIRDGLQMECIACTQCIDACDAVMDRTGQPRGLIRYGSRDAFEGRTSRVLRPRVLIYPAVLVVTFGLFITVLVTRQDTDLTVFGGAGAPYTLQQGMVVNQVRIKLVNRASRDRRYHLSVDGVPGSRVVVPINPLPVAAGRMQTTSLFVALPAGEFRGGRRGITVRVNDGARWSRRVDWTLLGPRAVAR